MNHKRCRPPSFEKIEQILNYNENETNTEQRARSNGKITPSLGHRKIEYHFAILTIALCFVNL